MFFAGCIFSEMAFQKWIVLYTFLSLLTFMMEIRNSSACVKDMIAQIEKTITDLQSCKNWNYSGKSANCPFKTKW